MFHKNTEKLESLIGASSTVKGDIDTKGTLRVDGVVEGSLTADWVVIGEKAHITGDITARGIIIGGRVDGNLKAKELVEMKNKGSIYGEIVTLKLAIAEGAVFEGKSSMHKEESKVIELLSKEKSR
ncbi:MAG: polymer-forming cytoskeletal protein [Nitrospirae bacterium]|nr:polymer-forming cytoskeletal protein [Nitrospirota bacterium]